VAGNYPAQNPAVNENGPGLEITHSPFVACKKAMNGLENDHDPGFHHETLRLS
jgi:hypothetical protein